jgi:hypothetical protein
MRTFLAAAISISLLVSGAMAGESAGPLVPGKPAGVKRAQEMGVSTTALVIITGIVVAGVAIGLSNSSDGNPGGPVPLTTTPTTTIVP